MSRPTVEEDQRALATLQVILGGGLLLAAAGARFGLHDAFHLTTGGSPLPWQTALLIGWASLAVVGLGYWRWINNRITDAQWSAVAICGVVGFGEICLLIALLASHRRHEIPWFGPTAVGAALLLAAGASSWRPRPWTRWVQIAAAAIPIQVVLIGTASAAFTLVFRYDERYIPRLLLLAGGAAVTPLLMVFQFLVQPTTAAFFRGGRPMSPAEAESIDRVSGSASRFLHSGGIRVLVWALLVCWFGLATLSLGIPNKWNRGKQRRTMATLRTVAVAVGYYAEDHSVYPAAANIHELARILEPHYLKTAPRIDGWGWPLDYHSYNEGLHYVLRSPGNDGIFETADPLGYSFYEFLGTDWHGDIVHTDGAFSRWPEWGMEP